MLGRPVCVTATSVLLSAALLGAAVCGCHPISGSQNQQPVEITSVLGPLQPTNPAGPIVEITLENVSVEPVVSLNATLGLTRPFEFAFNVTPSHPLQPGASTGSRLTLIGGGFSDSVWYPLTINATLESGAVFIHTEMVQIVEPPLNSRAIPAVLVAGLIAAGLVVLFKRRTGAARHAGR